jgi:ABC-type branched-subunit amino acid transport system ATPase component/ABC-type branched-subunit amino acid transport system permease subunit
VLSGNFQRNLMALLAAYALAALGLNLLVGIAGQISLGHGAFMMIGGYTAAILTVKAGLPPFVGVLAAGLFTAVVGWLLGLPALRLRGHFLALATLSFGTALPQVALKWDPVTGGAFGLSPTKFPSDLAAYWVIALVLGVCTWVSYNLVSSRPGRALLALRESEVAAQAMGVNLALAKTGIFAFSAMYAGLAGALATHLSGYISPNSFSLAVSFQLLASIVVGGLGSIGGSILGALLVAWLPFAASRTQGLASVVEGLAIIAIVIFLPRGIASLLERWRSRRDASRATEAVPPATHAAAAPSANGGPDPRLAQSLTGSRAAGTLLEVAGLSVDFGGVHALQDVSFCVSAGSIHGLIGPNGAGKTTALNCISRLIDPTRGAIRFGGQDLLAVHPSRVAHLGISRTFQNLELCRHLSALDNVMIGLHHRVVAPNIAYLLRLPAGRRAEAEARRRALELLDLVECLDVVDRPVQSLPHSRQKRVELARALACGGQLLVLDEPAAGLDASEREALADLVRRVRDAGLTILLVEHDMALVMSLCDRVTVLDFGRVIADGSPEEAQADPAVVAAYLGEDASRTAVHA